MLQARKIYLLCPVRAKNLANKIYLLIQTNVGSCPSHPTITLLAFNNSITIGIWDQCFAAMLIRPKL